MQDNVYLYDLMIFFYAVSVFLYFIDFLQPDRRVNRIALGFLAVVWVIQSTFFGLRMAELNYVPVLTTFETMVFFSWILITFSVAINYFYKIDLFTFFTNVIGFGVLSFVTFSNKGATSIAESLQGNLLILHITLAFLSYAAFLISSVFSLMYLIQERLLKARKWNSLARRLPALEQLDTFSYRLIMFGFPVLVIAVILGAIWYDAKFGTLLILDAKPIVSTLLLALYAVYFYMRIVAQWLGRRLAWLNIISFGAVVMNYLLVGQYFSGFHHWR